MASPFSIFLIILSARWAINNPKKFGRAALSVLSWMAVMGFVLGLVFIFAGLLETYAPVKRLK